MAAILIAAATVGAQTVLTQASETEAVADSVELRTAALRQARYLKSIYKTDAAIEALSPFVMPGHLDEEVLAELADCHFQSGDYQTAAGTYVLLSTLAPDNLLYKVRQMQTAYRLKAFEQSAQAGKAILQRDSIPAIAELVGDSFNQLNLPDSALSYYNIALAVKPLSENAVSKASKILLSRKDYDGALGLAESFLALAPDNMTVAPVKGLALYSKEDYAGAIEVFERQKEVGNDSYSVHFYLGQSYWDKESGQGQGGAACGLADRFERCESGVFDSGDVFGFLLSGDEVCAAVVGQGLCDGAAVSGAYGPDTQDLCSGVL